MRNQTDPTLLIPLTAGLVAAPLSTGKNRKREKITALIPRPPEFANAIMEGEVKESRGGGKVSGKSILNFSFHHAVRCDKPVTVNSEVKAIYNSKGKERVDEDGRVIEKKSNAGKVPAVTGVGVLPGGLAGCAKGATAALVLI